MTRSIAAVIVASALFCAGCAQKEIGAPDFSPRVVDIAFMWGNAPGADPAGMTVCFYPRSEGARMWRFDIPGRSGGSVELPPGSYEMVAVNNDLPGVVYSSMPELSVSARVDADGVAASSGMVYGAAVGELTVTPCGVSYRLPDGTVKECGRGLVRCSPDSLSTIYHISVTDVNEPSTIRSATARLSGCGARLDIASGRVSGGPVSLAARLEPDARGGVTLAGETSGFGGAGSGRDFELTVTVARTDGKFYARSFDVGGQVVNSSSPRNVYISVNGSDIPGAGEGGGDSSDADITVGVDGWHEVEINIETGP